MSQKVSYLRVQFLTWLFANILGFGALGALIVFVPFLMTIPGMVASTLIISLPIGLAQWIALRRILQTSIAWIISVPIGILLANFITRVIPYGLWPGMDDESIAGMTIAYLIVGFSIGLPQWLILRSHLSRASIWLLGSSIAVGASFWLILATGLVNQSGVIAYIVGALVYTIVTGLTLSALLATTDQSQAKLANAS